MFKKIFYAVSAAVLCLAVPAAVWALSRENDRALHCADSDNPICGLYQVCRPILDRYPEAEITEKGKDCTLSIESRQIIIRRKMTADGSGYFFYTNRLPPQKIPARS